VTPACFLVTKLTAFGDRGRRHPIASHDLEDVIAVIDGREEITADVTAAREPPGGDRRNARGPARVARR
jgi:hypothetical protein